MQRTIYEREYDNPLKKDGTEKANRLLGVFEVEKQLTKFKYDEKFIGKKDGKRYLVEGVEVWSGTKYTVVCLE